MLEKAVLRTVSVCRSLFYNTPLGKSRIATKIYQAMFKMAYKNEDKRISYQGVELWVPTKDITIVPGLINGYYEKLELELFSEFIKDSSVFLDVGGNLGLYSLIAAKHGSKKLRAYSFEPVPENIGYFKRNIELNPGTEKQITLIEKAVGSAEGKLTLNLSPVTVGTHTAVELDVPGVTHIEVPVTSLDIFMKSKKLKQVDILKVDVEGFEGEVLKGAEELIKTYKPTIFIEYLPELMKRSQSDLEDFRKLLFQHYKYCFLVDEIAQSIKVIPVKDIPLDSFNGNIILTNSKEHAERINQRSS